MVPGLLTTISESLNSASSSGLDLLPLLDVAFLAALYDIASMTRNKKETILTHMNGDASKVGLGISSFLTILEITVTIIF